MNSFQLESPGYLSVLIVTFPLKQYEVGDADVDGVVDGNNDVVGGIDVDGCTDELDDNGVIVGDAVDGVVDGNNDVVVGIDVDGCTDGLGDNVVIGMEKIVVSSLSKSLP